MAKKHSPQWTSLNTVFDTVMPSVANDIFLTEEILKSLSNAIAWLVAAGVPNGSQADVLDTVNKSIKDYEYEHRQNIEDHRLMRSRKFENPSQL